MPNLMQIIKEMSSLQLCKSIHVEFYSYVYLIRSFNLISNDYVAGNYRPNDVSVFNEIVIQQ